MASGKRIPFINVLRLLAMVFVLTPHLLAYQLENQVMIWVGTYVLNPLHIVQYCGALGVSLFFITSGYLTMPQAGTGRCVQRLYRQVLSLMVEVFAAMMFCMVVSYAFQALFTAINGHQGPYAAFTLRDWLASAVLYRNFMFRVSTEGILWFLVPFLMFKLGLILLDKPLRRLEQRGNGPWLFFGAVVLGFAIRALWPAFNYITERFFYMGIILMGYIFALLNHGRISKAKCALLQGVNLALMLFSLQMTQVGIDNGYIVSALYAAVLFYGCYKLRDSFHYNRFPGLYGYHRPALLPAALLRGGQFHSADLLRVLERVLHREPRHGHPGPVHGADAGRGHRLCLWRPALDCPGTAGPGPAAGGAQAPRRSCRVRRRTHP